MVLTPGIDGNQIEQDLEHVESSLQSFEMQSLL